MAFVPNWIAAPNAVEGAPGPWQHFVMADAGGGTYYALLDDNIGDMVLYVSNDDTATWTLLNNTCPYLALANYKLFLQYLGGANPVIKIAIGKIATGPSSFILDFIDYDINTDTWSAITNIGGGFDQNSHGGIADQACTGVLRFTRQDGSEIIAYQCENGGMDLGYWQVRILKLSGSTWTELALLSNPEIFTYYILFSGGINPVTDQVDLFINVPTDTADDHSIYQTSDMCHVAVAADDTVSGVNTIELLEEFMPANLNPNQAQDSSENGRVAYSDDGLTIAFGWGYWTNTYPAGNAACGVHVGIGDLSGDPLNPTWSAEIVATAVPQGWNNGFSNDVNVSFLDEPVIYLEAFGNNDGSNKVWCGAAHHTGGGTGLKVYFGSRVNAAVNNTSKLFWSLRTGTNTWAVPAILYPDPDRDTIHMDGFDIPPPFPETPPPSLTLACPVGGGTATIGVPYSAFLVVGGDYTPPLFFEIIDGELPPGLSLNSATGEISGTPFGSGGTFQVKYQVTDSSSPPQVATT